MNLFIFRVETGTMLEFQLEMTTESVAQLKLEISRILDVPPEDQVLLVSGGTCLENSAKVISYSSGTDTNPIFLFSKQSIESSVAPSASACPNSYTAHSGKQRRSEAGSDEVFTEDAGDGIHATGYSSYNEFRKRVLQSKNLPSTMETVTKRARLAQEFYEEAMRESQCCQNIVYDQQLQHQGWLAAIANLEDITNDFQKRISSVRQFFDEYIDQRNSYVEFLSVYKEALEKLAKIPIIPTLLLAEFESSTGETQDADAEQGETASKSTIENKVSKTLLEWIEARRDSNSETTMDSLFETCSRGIEYYHAELFANLYEEVQYAYVTASNAEMKEISGLSKRLFSLDQLTHSCEPLVKEQNYSAQSFQNNQARAGDLRDNSVLPDLCTSHGKQLVCMLKNHWKLCDIHKRCMRSKEELCSNLHQRLKWVIHAENLLRGSTDRILAYYEHVLRLRFNLSVLQQIHMAPEAYMAAVVEVLRRKKFSQAFLLWASELACYMLTIYNDEVTRRKDFKSKYDGHFLMGLFPGMNDLPPSFATQAPSIFDSSLPNVTIDDIEELKKAVPELMDSLTIPDMTAITNFFLTKSQVKSEDKAEGTCEEKLVQVVNEVGLASNLDQNLLKPGESETCLLPHGIAQLKDLDRGCESETDTEEFEKVCQSPMDLQFEKDLLSPRPGYSDVTTITEDNLQSSRSEQDKLKDLLVNMATIYRSIFAGLRLDMAEIKAKVQCESSALGMRCKSLSSSWDNVTHEFERKEKEILKLTESHQHELSSFRQQLKSHGDEIKCLREENSCLDSSLNKLVDENKQLLGCQIATGEDHKTQIADLQAKLREKSENERSLKETMDRMGREHKTEMDNLRKKFRFMTDRSPSECQDKPPFLGDSPDLKRKEPISEGERNKIIEEVRQAESFRVEKVLIERSKEYEFELKKIRDEAKRTLDEKDKLIATLNLDCMKQKNLILQMTESQMESSMCELREHVEILQKEKDELEQQLTSERLKRMETSEMTASTSSCSGAKRSKYKEPLTISQTSLVNMNRVNVETCSKGDRVLVMWKSKYKNFIVLQESDVLHFVHSDCIREYQPLANEDTSIYFTAQVLEKEYCQTKKSENRYNVPKGTKFYRVKIVPIGNSEEGRPAIQMSQSHNVPKSTPLVPMDESVSDSACHSLPSTPTKEDQ